MKLAELLNSIHRAEAPPWNDPQAMRRWLMDFLAKWEAWLEEGRRRDDTYITPGAVRWATQKADQENDLVPLKKLFPPETAKYIQPIKRRGTGKHLRPPNPRLEKALNAVVLIRCLLIVRYGKWKQVRPTPADIAAKLYGIHEASVEGAVKKGRLSFDQTIVTDNHAESLPHNVL